MYISSVELLSRVRHFATPWTAARQAYLSITSFWPTSMSIESMMPSNHLIFCSPLLLLLSVFPSFRVFSNDSALGIRWPKYWSFSLNISPSKEHQGQISFRMDWLDLLDCCLMCRAETWELIIWKCFHSPTMSRKRRQSKKQRKKFLK